ILLRSRYLNRVEYGIVLGAKGLNYIYSRASGNKNQNIAGGELAGAAFYDLEGTLVSTNLVHTLSFYAGRQQGLMASFKMSAATFLSLPVFAVTDQYSRKVFNDLYFKRYKGQSEDRLRYFAQDLFEDVIKPAVFPGAYELIE